MDFLDHCSKFFQLKNVFADVPTASGIIYAGGSVCSASSYGIDFMQIHFSRTLSDKFLFAYFGQISNLKTTDLPVNNGQ
jgi:hypothetical protein